MLAKAVQGYSTPTSMFVMKKRRFDPAWTFNPECGSGDEDNNLKYLGMSNDPDAYPFAGNYWYHDQTPQKCSLEDSWTDSFYSSGQLGDLLHAPSSSGGDARSTEDPWFEWVNFEYRVGLGPAGQRLKYLLNNTSKGDLSGLNTDDAPAGSRSFGLGTYSRRGGEDDWMFLADCVLVVGADAYKRVMLTDNAEYTASSIVEFQHIIEWDDTISIRINRGMLPAGIAHIHVFDENDASTYAGSLTLV